MIYKEITDSRFRAFHALAITRHQVACKSPAFKKIMNDCQEKIHSLEKLILK